jgi:hypothetical protein
MGVYELMEGKEVNGRGVWQIVGGVEYSPHFMYFGRTKEWIIGDREDIEAGKEAEYMYVASTALTPDQVTETWQVYDEDEDTWVDAPKVRARMCSAEQKRAAASRQAGAGAAAGDGGGEAGEGYSHVGLYLDVSRRM